MIALTTLGTAGIVIGDSPLAPAAERAFAMLMYLGMERGRSVQRTALQGLIFPDGATKDGAHSLRQLLYKLRQGGAPIETDASTVSIPADQVHDDVAAIIASESFTSDELRALRGGYLGGYAPAFSAPFTEWLEQHRGGVTAQLRRLLVARLGDARKVNDWNAIEDLARACLALDPLNEEATLARSEALTMVGSKAEAVALLDGYMADMGKGASDLRVPAAVLRRRISERVPVYSPATTGDVPLVGRQRELDTLLDALRSVRAGRPRTMRVTGEAGIGKSRLVEEFARIAALEGAAIVVVRAHPSDVRRPLSAFYDAVPRLLALPGALGCSPTSMEFLRRFSRLRGDVSTTIGEAERDSELLFANITTGIQDLLAAVASESSLLIVVEDAHWLDDHSARLIDEGLRSTETIRLGIVLRRR